MTDASTAAAAPTQPLPEFPATDAAKLTELALDEDLGDFGDVTSQLTIPADATGAVRIVARQPGTLAGLPLATLVAARVDGAIRVTEEAADGQPIEPGQAVCTLTGPVRGLLAAERTILNFMTHLSGIASLTAAHVAGTRGTKAVVLDTRKTLPGWRRLAKYAVACGGGTNHRMGLHDAVLIKDNHLAAARQSDPGESLAELLQRVRGQLERPLSITIEVDTLAQFREALPGAPDIVLLDNMPPAVMAEAVAYRDEHAPKVQLEASGGIDETTIAAVAGSGVDRISVGALTHSAKTLDLGFDWV